MAGRQDPYLWNLSAALQRLANRTIVLAVLEVYRSCYSLAVAVH